MKITTIVGARPQFIKASPVSKALAACGHQEILLHTGQHYDESMSGIFFRELEIRPPDVNLHVGSGSHGKQTAEMLEGIERELLANRPDALLIYGDTNSTLAGALAAIKLGIPVAHVEAGLRSFNRTMPEEHNRVLVDHCSDLLFCPTKTAVRHLASEGVTKGVHLVGDTMLDAVLFHGGLAQKKSAVLQRLGVADKGFYLATLHRPYNTDVSENLQKAMRALGGIGGTVILPLHPRTRGKLQEFKIKVPETVKLVEPLGYLDMLEMTRCARVVLTDSGGLQKEAFFLGVPCVTLRTETEWVETVEAGWNLVVGVEPGDVVKATQQLENTELPPPGTPFGSGAAAEKIVAILEERFS